MVPLQPFCLFLFTALEKRFNFVLSHVTFHFSQHYLLNRLSSCTGRVNIVKVVILSKAIHRYSAVPIKTSMAFFRKLEQMILKFTWRHRRPQVAKAVLRESLGVSLMQISECTTELPESKPCGASSELAT